MEHKLTITNFGPIEKVDLKINDFTVFIGEQASGKSTVAKCIYFFKSLRDDLLTFLYTAIEQNEADELYREYRSGVSQKFLDMWGATLAMPNFEFKYTIDSTHWIKVYVDAQSKYITTKYSRAFDKELNGLMNSVSAYVANHAARLNRPQAENASARESLKNTLKRGAYALFDDSSDEYVYIPAGRSLITLLSSELTRIDSRQIDYTTSKFIERVNSIKPYYEKSFQQLIAEQELFGETQVDRVKLDLFIERIEKILKGRYQRSEKEERLYIKGEDRYIKMNYASSGQQESVWILLQLFMFALTNKKVFVVIEEPEAHLYPETQNEIVQLIVQLFRSNPQNKVIITTHSPYVLASLNNLLYAHKLGSDRTILTSDVEAIVKESSWLDFERVDAYRTLNGRLDGIKEQELKLIRAEEIDSASRIINGQFDQLTDLEYNG